MLNTVIIQPPLVQLNTPYPSGAYLLSFFKKLYEERKIQGDIQWLDLSTELFHKVFCRQGIKKIFEKSSQNALKAASNFEKNGDENTAFQLRRYLCQKDSWIEWIDTIVQIVCQKQSFSGSEFTHEFVRSAHVPRGNRVEVFLSGLAESGRDIQADDAKILASLSLADLADYITVAYDENFSLIRYAESLASSYSTFDDILKNLNAPILKDFLEPLLQEKLSPFPTDQDTLFCITVPFPGCFQAALFSANLIRSIYGKKAFIAFGGGYINTELRQVGEKRLFDFCHILSYDKGYGSYSEIFDLFEKNSFSCQKSSENLYNQSQHLYKIRYLSKDGIINQKEKDEKLENYEREMLKNVIPDFSSIDFSRSPRLADDNNAMHRIWNDGAWLKAFMAYGCYWHRCAFCDTSLDYVKNYCGTNISYLYDGLYEQAEKTGIYGIHFVDEACPPVSLQRFALKNLEKAGERQRLTFWGNIRFEKTFSRDLADLLSRGGLTAVSGGIEIATGKGLNSVNKGTEIQNIVNAICAFKEAGILVHTYMIFGFWNQSEQDLIDSMETLRQMFAQGLIDSAFWHKFSLTRHSTVFKEWQEGKHPELKPILKENSFAENDIEFEGQEKSQKYAEPLNTALNFWMNGEKLGKNVESYFSFKVPKPSIPKNYVENLIFNYEKKRNSDFYSIPKDFSNRKCVWLGGSPLLQKISSDRYQICWSYMGEIFQLDFADKSQAQSVIDLLEAIKAENFCSSTRLQDISGAADISASSNSINSTYASASIFELKVVLDQLKKKTFTALRGKGLCILL